MTQDDKRWVNERLDELEAILPLIPTLKPHLKEIKEAIKKLRVGEVNPLIPNPYAWIRNYFACLRLLMNESYKDVGTQFLKLRELIIGALGKDYEVPLDDTERQKQRGKPWYARDLKDFNDLKYVHIYDKTNNKIPGRTKKNISQSDSAIRLRWMMDNERSGYRAKLEAKKEKERRSEEKRKQHVKRRGDVY